MPRHARQQAKTKSKRQARKEDTEEEESSGCDTNRFDDQRFGESEEDEDGNVTFPVAPTSGKRKRK